MFDYMIFSFFIVLTFLIVAFPIVLDIIKIAKKESIARSGLVRRSVTLGLVFVYISMLIFNFIFAKGNGNGITDDFKTILLTVVGYYFGKSTALDDPKK